MNRRTAEAVGLMPRARDNRRIDTVLSARTKGGAIAVATLLLLLLLRAAAAVTIATCSDCTAQSHGYRAERSRQLIALNNRKAPGRQCLAKAALAQPALAQAVLVSMDLRRQSSYLRAIIELVCVRAVRLLEPTRCARVSRQSSQFCDTERAL